MAGYVDEFTITLNATSAGSSDTLKNDWQVKPTGRPWTMLLTIVMPEAKRPTVLRNSRGLSSGVRVGSWSKDIDVPSGEVAGVATEYETDRGRISTTGFLCLGGDATAYVALPIRTSEFCIRVNRLFRAFFTTSPTAKRRVVYRVKDVDEHPTSTQKL